MIIIAIVVVAFVVTVVVIVAVAVLFAVAVVVDVVVAFQCQRYCLGRLINKYTCIITTTLSVD